MLRTFVAALAAAALACGSGGGAASKVGAPGPASDGVPKPDDSPPVVTVASPAPEALARPVVTVSATCTSGGKECASFALRAKVAGREVPGGDTGDLLTGTRSLSGDVDLSAYEGEVVDLEFTGFDEANRHSVVSRIVYVESSRTLSVVAAAPGPIWDYSDGRILFVDVTACPSSIILGAPATTCFTAPVLRIRDTTSDTTEDLEASVDVVGTWGCYGYLTSSGAIYAHGEQGDSTFPYCWGHEWRDGVSIDLGGLNSCQSLRVAGSYALFSTQSVPDGVLTLVRRDLRTGANTPISTEAGNWMNDVTASGDVVYWGNDFNVYRWGAGVSAALTGDSSTFWNTYPVTDGVNVVYRKTDPAAWTHALVLDDGHGAVELRPAEASDPLPEWDYAIANGWVAYTRADSTEVWRHSSTGEELLASFGSRSHVDGIAPDGTVLLTSGSRRYRAVPGKALQDIGSALGTIVYRAGAFYDIVGGTVLEVNP